MIYGNGVPTLQHTWSSQDPSVVLHKARSNFPDNGCSRPRAFAFQVNRTRTHSRTSIYSVPAKHPRRPLCIPSRRYGKGASTCELKWSRINTIVFHKGKATLPPLGYFFFLPELMDVPTVTQDPVPPQAIDPILTSDPLTAIMDDTLADQLDV
jgi:hypothetical protein